MSLFASGLAERGLDALTFNFLYMEQRRHVPDKNDKLEVCYRAVIESARTHKELKGNRIVIGGKSMGGRIASQVAAYFANHPSAGDTSEGIAGSWPIPAISGLVLLGYPLHPLGRPDKLRDAHLADIKAPMLIAQGARDAFGSADELRAVIKKHRLPATLYVIEGGDHSFKVPKSLGVTQAQIYENVMDEITRWLLSKPT
jgi:predicted alpha/beta-hydrolase family hydrolase